MASNETACSWSECGRESMGLRRNDKGEWVLVCQKHYDEEEIEFHRVTLDEYTASLP